MTITCKATRIDIDEVAWNDRTWNVKWELTDDTGAAISANVVRSTCRQKGPNKVQGFFSALNVSGVSDPFAFLRSTNFRQDESTRAKWHIDGVYKTLGRGETLAANQSNDPTARGPVSWFESDTSTEAVEEAYLQTPLTGIGHQTGDLIAPVNAAGSPFQTAILEDVHRAVLATKLIFGSLDEIAELNRNFQRTTNSDTFLQYYPPHHCRYMWTDCSEPITEAGFVYYEGIRRILLSADPLYRRVVNEGFYELSDEGKLIRSKDDEGLDTVEAVLLGVDGTRLADGVIGNTVDYRPAREVLYADLKY